MIAIKPIPNTNEKYFVTSDGHIISYSRKNFTDYVLTQRLNSSGYLYVDIRVQGKKKKLFIHRAIALAFLDNPDNKPCVNHKDGNKLNNCIDNLEWCTYSENMKHAVDMGLNSVPNFSGENHPMHKLTEEKVCQIRKLSLSGVSSPSIAKQFGITKEQVYNIIKKYQWRNVI